MVTGKALLNVRDMDKSAAFYLDLGFTVKRIVRDENNAPYLTTLTLDGAEIHLSAISANDDADYREWVSGTLGAGVVLAFAVDDVDAFFMKVTGATNAHVESPITDSPFGRLFMVHDPDGYVLMFIKEHEPDAPQA